MRKIILCASAFACLISGAAIADECRAPLPLKGTTFSGSLTAVLDGDSICVGQEDGGIEVRIADFYAPGLREPGGLQARRTLEAIAFQRDVICEAGKRSWDRVVALCRLNDGTALGEAMRSTGVAEGGRGWPPREGSTNRQSVQQSMLRWPHQCSLWATGRLGSCSRSATRGLRLRCGRYSEGVFEDFVSRTD